MDNADAGSLEGGGSKNPLHKFGEVKRALFRGKEKEPSLPNPLQFIRGRLTQIADTKPDLREEERVLLREKAGEFDELQAKIQQKWDILKGLEKAGGEEATPTKLREAVFRDKSAIPVTGVTISEGLVPIDEVPQLEGEDEVIKGRVKASPQLTQAVLENLGFINAGETLPERVNRINSSIPDEMHEADLIKNPELEDERIDSETTEIALKYKGGRLALSLISNRPELASFTAGVDVKGGLVESSPVFPVVELTVGFNNNSHNPEIASQVEEALMRSVTGHKESRVGKLAGRAKEVVGRGAENVALVPSKMRETAQKLKEAERIRAVRAGLKEVPKVAEGAVLKSRESRLATEEKNRQKGIIQKTFSTTLGRWVLKPLAESIPSPVLYGPGDILTGISALVGRDVLTGDKLDGVDRILYGVATAIPGVPSAVLIVPAKLIRRGGEDFIHARRQGDAGGMKEGAQNLKEGIRGVRKALGDNKDTKPTA